MRLPTSGIELVDDAHSLVGHHAQLFNGPLEPRELAPEVINRRFDARAPRATFIGKEEVGCGAARNRADQGAR